MGSVQTILFMIGEREDKKIIKFLQDEMFDCSLSIIKHAERSPESYDPEDIAFLKEYWEKKKRPVGSKPYSNDADNRSSKVSP